MSDKLRDLLINLATGGVIAVAVFFLGLSREYTVLRCLCDAAFVAGALLLSIGGIKGARNKGTFDVAGFGVSYTMGLVFPALRREEKETMEQYRERKASERKPAAGQLLAGVVYLALSLVFLLLYYLVYE